MRPKILRIFKIWEQRSVYDDEFLSDLTGLLSAGAIKKTDDDPLDFQVMKFHANFVVAVMTKWVTYNINA